MSAWISYRLECAIFRTYYSVVGADWRAIALVDRMKLYYIEKHGILPHCISLIYIYSTVSEEFSNKTGFATLSAHICSQVIILHMLLQVSVNAVNLDIRKLYVT